MAFNDLGLGKLRKIRGPSPCSKKYINATLSSKTHQLALQGQSPGIGLHLGKAYTHPGTTSIQCVYQIYTNACIHYAKSFYVLTPPYPGALHSQKN